MEYGWKLESCEKYEACCRETDRQISVQSEGKFPQSQTTEPVPLRLNARGRNFGRGLESRFSAFHDSRFCEAKEFSRRVIHAAFVGSVVTVRMTSSKFTILTEAEKGRQPDN